MYTCWAKVLPLCCYCCICISDNKKERKKDSLEKKPIRAPWILKISSYAKFFVTLHISIYVDTCRYIHTNIFVYTYMSIYVLIHAPRESQKFRIWGNFLIFPHMRPENTRKFSIRAVYQGVYTLNFFCIHLLHFILVYTPSPPPCLYFFFWFLQQRCWRYVKVYTRGYTPLLLLLLLFGVHNPTLTTVADRYGPQALWTISVSTCGKQSANCTRGSLYTCICM